MLGNLILETSSAPGSNASITLLGAATGRRSFNSAFGVGPVFFYILSDGLNLEWGVGSLTAASTLSRTTVLGNSAGTTARLNFSGTTSVYNSLPSERTLYRDTNLRLQMAGQRIEGLAASAGADHAVRQDQVLMLGTGGTITGTVTATRLANDANSYSELSAGNPVIALDANDYQHYNRSNNTWSLVTSATTRFYVNDTDAVSTVPLTLSNAGTGAANAVRRDYVDASVNARLSLSGGQVNGNLTVTGAMIATSHVQTYNSSNGSQGTIYLNSSNTRYLSNDGTNYILHGQHLFVNGGSVWTSGNLPSPMTYAGGGFTGAISSPNIYANGPLASAGNLTVSGQGDFGQRVYCNSPRAGGGGWAMVSGARFGPWQWNDSGYVAIDVDGAGYGITVFASDERLKEEIAPATEGSLDLIRQLDFVDFRFKKLPNAPDDLVMPLQKSGVLAQQLQALRPALVQEMDDEQGTLLPNPMLLIANTMQAIQELDAEVTALKARLAALENPAA